ncbi:cation transporter [Acinetobacter baumannii]
MSKEKLLRRSSIFISVLLSLFIFQSLWNVTTTYCGHENSSQQSTLDSDFGYGIVSHAESITKQQHSYSIDKEMIDLPMPLSLQDHHDHLPSCFHVVLTEIQQQLKVPVFPVQISEQKYYWSNFYESPYLSGINPPPLFSKL